MHPETIDELEIGDEVIIRSDLRVGQSYGPYPVWFVAIMSKFTGAKVTVSEMVEDHGFKIEEDGGKCTWCPRLIERIIGKEVEEIEENSNKVGRRFEFNPTEDGYNVQLKKEG